jgi:putative DNA primase/helicase
MATTLEVAAGRWPQLLMDLGGLSPEQLTDKHQPCPACGGTDRYRWDRDDGPGGCFCNQCGGKDSQGGAMSGLDLLMRVRSWDLKQALRNVEQHLGIATSSTPTAAVAKPKGRPHRIPDTPPPDAPAPALGRATAQWCYRNAAGEQLFWIQRIPQHPKPGADPNAKPAKLFVHRTWLDGGWHYPSRRDGFASDWPTPRPLYNLPALNQQHDAPVLIAEGEKSADAAASLFPDHACLAWCGGTGGINAADWSPLAGRSVTLWPDADAPGRQVMAKLAQRLLPIAASVRVVAIPDGAPSGWDLADAVTDGWTPKQAATVAAKFAKSVEAPPEPTPPPDQPAPPEPVQIPSSRPFACLGFDDASYFYQPNTTGQVVKIGRASHTGVNLLQLCPDMAYWETLYPGSAKGPNWTAAAASLFAEQARVGIYDRFRIRGRGAWWDDGRSVLHLGDRLVVDGNIHPVASPPPSRFNYQRLASIDLPTDLPPLTDQEGAEILDIASRFLWEVPASGLLIAGWTALAPICGSLSWRPHIWLTASAGSGKSALLDRFLGTLLQEIALWPEGSTTEPSIRQELRADAKPVIMDEAESNEQADRKRIQDILALARVASSSGRGFVGRGGADGTAERFVARAMFLLCSINTAIKQGADASRFAALTLRNPSFLPKEERVAHWRALDRDLTRVITPELGHRMILRSVELIPVIRDSVAAFRRAAADRFDSQRQGDQYGTLLAGAWSLMNTTVATEADAYALIDGNDWAAYREAAEQPDEERCLQHILQHQLRVEIERTEVNGGKVFSRNMTITRTVWELVETIASGQESTDVPHDAAQAHLGRIGIKVENDRLMVSNTAKGLHRILNDTAWAHNWGTVLSRLPDAQKAGVTRFRGIADVSRAVSLPIKA